MKSLAIWANAWDQLAQLQRVLARSKIERSQFKFWWLCFYGYSSLLITNKYVYGSCRFSIGIFCACLHCNNHDFKNCSFWDLNLLQGIAQFASTWWQPDKSEQPPTLVFYFVIAICTWIVCNTTQHNTKQNKTKHSKKVNIYFHNSALVDFTKIGSQLLLHCLWISANLR